MKKSVLIYLLFLSGLITFGYSNCGQWRSAAEKASTTTGQSSTTNSTSNTTATPTAGTTVADKAMALLAKDCATCHGPQTKLGPVAFDVTNYQSMIDLGEIRPNDLAGSKIYTRMDGAANPMPTSGRLPDDQIRIIADWIQQGAVKPGTTVPPVVEVLDPLKTPKTYTNVKKFILDGKCVACHKQGNAKGGVRYDTYAETLRTVRSGLVSEIQSNSMPPRNDRVNYPAVTAVELRFIQDWIALGAPEN